MQKTLVVYYSRTGTNKKVAQKIAQSLNADIEEIISEKNRAGIWGYLISGYEGMGKKPAAIKPPQKDPAHYDLVIIGTPMWVNVSSPIRAYILQNKDKFKKLAFFCVRGGEKEGNIFVELENVSGRKAVAVLALRTKDIVKDNFEQKTQEFINKIN